MKNRKIKLIAKLTNILGLNKITTQMYKLSYGENYIRAINYHSTPENYMGQFEEQIKFFSENYVSVSKKDLELFLSGKWNKDKPGLIISFDDGLESNYKYAKQILDKYDFKGWFFIPAGLIEKGNCRAEDLTGNIAEKYMNWEQVKDLYKNHVIGSHTLSHKRLNSGLSESMLKKEIYDSKLLLEKKVEGEIDIFCWVGGEIGAYSKEASEIIKKSGYKFSFLTNHYPITMENNPLLLERTNVEADWPLDLVKLYMSPLMDLKYRKKRKYIRNLIK